MGIPSHRPLKISREQAQGGAQVGKIHTGEIAEAIAKEQGPLNFSRGLTEAAEKASPAGDFFGSFFHR